MVELVFETMPMPHKDIPQPDEGRYRIYKDIDDFTLVTAASALDALKKSGVELPYKIVRESLDKISVLGADSWDSLEEAAEETPAAEAESSSDEAKPEEEATSAEGEEKPAKEVEAAAPDAEAEKKSEDDEALSGDDVDKLLNE